MAEFVWGAGSRHCQCKWLIGQKWCGCRSCTCSWWQLELRVGARVQVAWATFRFVCTHGNIGAQIDAVVQIVVGEWLVRWCWFVQILHCHHFVVFGVGVFRNDRAELFVQIVRCLFTYRRPQIQFGRGERLWFAHAIHRAALVLLRCNEFGVWRWHRFDVFASRCQNLFQLMPVFVEIDFGFGYKFAGCMLRSQWLNDDKMEKSRSKQLISMVRMQNIDNPVRLRGNCTKCIKCQWVYVWYLLDAWIATSSLGWRIVVVLAVASASFCVRLGGSTNSHERCTFWSNFD